MLKKLSLKQRLLAIMPFIFWGFLAVVIYAMLIELPPRRGGWPHWDKVQHLVIFMVLAGLAFIAYPKGKRWMAALLIICGALVEWLQAAFTQTRMPSVGDWVADVAGVLLVLILYKWIATQSNQKACV